MKRRISVRVFITTLLVSLVLGMSSTVFAQSTYGDWGYFGPFLGVNYSCIAAVWVDSNPNIFIAGLTQLDADQNVPPVYLGAKAYLYLEDGTLASANSAYKYNNSSVAGIVTSTPKYYQRTTLFYSRGLVRVIESVDSMGNATWSYWYTQTTPVVAS